METPNEMPDTVPTTAVTTDDVTSTQDRDRRMTMAGGIIGIVALSVGAIVGWFIPWLIVILGIVGLVLTAKGDRKGGWYPTGLTTNIIALVLSVPWAIFLTIAVITSASASF
jgi:hypothetical protein